MMPNGGDKPCKKIRKSSKFYKIFLPKPQKLQKSTALFAFVLINLLAVAPTISNNINFSRHYTEHQSAVKTNQHVKPKFQITKFDIHYFHYKSREDIYILIINFQNQK